MRIHSNELTTADIYTAARLAKAQVKITEHGSRKRARAFEVKLTGLSTRRPNFWSGDESEYAATWDQWGVFLGYLFALDADLITPYYPVYSEFHRITDGRFDLDYWEVQVYTNELQRRQAILDGATEIPFPLDHNHRWEFHESHFRHECAKDGCTAAMNR